MLIFAETPAERLQLSMWAAERIEDVGELGFGECQAAGVIRHGELVAAVLFHEWNPNARTLMLSMAAESPMWASREVVRDLFRYAFVTAGANKLWTSTAHDNTRALRFNDGVGLRREGTLRHHFGPKRHAVICSMLRSEWMRSRWYEDHA